MRLIIGYHFLDFNAIDWDEIGDDDDFELDGDLPDEDDVMELAGAWSINPQTLEDLGLPPGLGYLGRLPDP